MLDRDENVPTEIIVHISAKISWYMETFDSSLEAPSVLYCSLKNTDLSLVWSGYCWFLKKEKCKSKLGKGFFCAWKQMKLF